ALSGERGAARRGRHRAAGRHRDGGAPRHPNRALPDVAGPDRTEHADVLERDVADPAVRRDARRDAVVGRRRRALAGAALDRARHRSAQRLRVDRAQSRRRYPLQRGRPAHSPRRQRMSDAVASVAPPTRLRRELRAVWPFLLIFLGFAAIALLAPLIAPYSP